MTEIKDQRVPLSPDLCRLGERLNGYLLAVKQITETFSQEKKKIVLEDVDILRLLQKILPALRKSFNSEIAFLADQKGKNIFSDQSNAGIVGKELPDTVHVKALIEKGIPLVVDDISGDFPELRSLNVRSLMVVRIETPIEFRFIGVANGKNSPFPYLAEDRDFLNELMRILEFGLNYGRLGEKKRHLRERYFWAQVRGEWEYLSGASEDYAQHLLPIKMIGEEKQKEIDNLLKMSMSDEYIDNVLADYLDAELSIYIGEASDSPTGSICPEDDTSKKEEPKSTKPWELFKPDEEGTGFKVILKDNNKETDETLLPSDYPRTALAAGRIYLFYANFRKFLRSTSSNKSNENEKDKYFSLYKNILKVVNEKYIKCVTKCDKGEDIIEGYPNYELHVDWLRLNWQYIYYRSCQGMVEPLEGYVERVVKTYSCIWKLTVKVLKQYLEEGTPETGLCIDSDWLIAWLACNVLLSKGLNEYYNLNPVESDDIKAESVNPIAKMRYFKNLSHYILYVLHCARYAMRKKIHEIKDKKKAEQFKRPPFSDIPLEPTSSLSKAQLYTMSEYAYREIGVHRELRIFERLSRQMYYELPLYAAGSFYRDHLYHVIDVCLLGELLLRSMMPGDGTAGKFHLLADQLTELPINDLLKNWYVAALCHDLGYVIEQADKFLKPIDEIKGEGISDFSGKVKGGLKAGKEEMREIIRKIVIEDSCPFGTGA